MGGEAVYVRGAGLHTVLGRGLPAHARALAPGVPGPTMIPDGPNIPPWPYHRIAGLEGDDRLHTLINGVVEDALADAALPDAARADLAVFVGSTCLDLPLHESVYAGEPGTDAECVAIRGPGYGNLAADIATRFDLAGPQYTINTACSSSANALLHARLLLLEGRAEHALVVGVEAYNRLSVFGFASLLLLSKAGYKPFDLARDGMILGEGAGAVLLTRARAGEHYPAIVGAATACDPTSPTNSNPERIAEVVRAALDDAGVGLADIAAIKAHGTGTPSNDAAEGQGMRSLAAQLPPLTSLKPYLGHTLGGCGIIELLTLWSAWQDGTLPSTPGFAQADPEVGVEPVTQARPATDGPLLLNFFGFGGNNTSVVVRRP